MDRMRASLEQVIKEHSIVIDEELHDLRIIMQEKAHSMSKRLSPGSFAGFLGESVASSQSEGCQIHTLRSYHDPLVHMADAGVEKLPSQRTLWDYTCHVQASTGFTDEVDNHLVNSARLTPRARHCHH
jgi:hypothetical protein